jgi:hypothetical protein
MTGRIFERKRRQMPCTLTFEGRNHGGMILDVSPGGLFIQSTAKIKPGDQVELQTTVPGFEGRMRLQIEVVRKVIVPAHLLKVAHGGVGVRILNAPETYYQFMESLGITADTNSGDATPSTVGEDTVAAPPPVVESRPEAEPVVEREALPAESTRFKVRVKQVKGSRSRVVEVEAASENEAQRRVLEDVGDEWVSLGVERLS